MAFPRRVHPGREPLAKVRGSRAHGLLGKARVCWPGVDGTSCWVLTILCEKICFGEIAMRWSLCGCEELKPPGGLAMQDLRR